MLKELRGRFRDYADADDAVFLTRFYKTAPGTYGAGDIFLGIRVPVIRRFVAEYANKLSLSQIRSLLRSRFHEERMLALLLLVRGYEKGGEAERQQIYECYLAHTRFINNWDLVDQSAPKIVGARLYEQGKPERLYSLALSDLLWDRRIAIVATHFHIRHNLYEPTLKIAAILMNDAEDLIHKACGWMLREVGKRDHAAEESFLRANCARMPRIMLRYAIERFPEKLRRQFLNCGKS